MEGASVQQKFKSKLIINNKTGRFKLKPFGIIIEDSYNNVCFPMKKPVIDDNSHNFSLIIEQYAFLYLKTTPDSNIILPWHFIIEFSQFGYIIYNTRPITLRYPFTTDDTIEIAKNNNINILLNKDKKLKVVDANFEISDYIHILLIGNSNIDVYKHDLYTMINKYIYTPYSYLFKFGVRDIHTINMGKHFDFMNILL